MLNLRGSVRALLAISLRADGRAGKFQLDGKFAIVKTVAENGDDLLGFETCFRRRLTYMLVLTFQVADLYDFAVWKRILLGCFEEIQFASDFVLLFPEMQKGNFDLHGRRQPRHRREERFLGSVRSWKLAEILDCRNFWEWVQRIFRKSHQQTRNSAVKDKILGLPEHLAFKSVDKTVSEVHEIHSSCIDLATSVHKSKLRSRKQVATTEQHRPETSAKKPWRSSYRAPLCSHRCGTFISGSRRCNTIYSWRNERFQPAKRSSVVLSDKEFLQATSFYEMCFFCVQDFCVSRKPTSFYSQML